MGDRRCLSVIPYILRQPYAQPHPWYSDSPSRGFPARSHHTTPQVSPYGNSIPSVCRPSGYCAVPSRSHNCHPSGAIHPRLYPLACGNILIAYPHQAPTSCLPQSSYPKPDDLPFPLARRQEQTSKKVFFLFSSLLFIINTNQIRRILINKFFWMQ